MEQSTTLAYIVGVAIGDGNLSNPNGRAVRLRITCDLRYPSIIQSIQTSLRKLFPKNRIGIVLREKSNCLDISCYSNKLETLLGWKVDYGPKHRQEICIPEWIKGNSDYTKACLKGLIETDGSIYRDRGYLFVNYVTIIPNLAEDVSKMIHSLGYEPKVYTSRNSSLTTKYTIRISRNTKKFIEELHVKKE